MTSSPSRKREIPAPRQPDFASVLKKYVAPLPPALVRKLGRTGESPLGKVKVMLKVCETGEDANGGPGTGILGIDQRKKQVTLIDPGGNNAGPAGSTPEERRVGVSAPKMFAFDGIFGEDDDQAETCAAAGAELVASVVGGEDGCFVSLGYSSGGKKQTMFGRPNNQKLGFIPTVISWLYRSIQEQKQKTGARFSVRVSAVEVTGGSGHEVTKDLLERFAIAGDQPPGAYIAENGGSGGNGKSFSTSAPPVLSGMSEVRAPNPETAGSYLDAALESMSKEDPVRHFVYTLHVYQYAVDKNGKGTGVGGRSRLHCVMLGNGSPSLSVLGGLLLAVLNGQRHLPSRDSKLGAILRECLGSLTCRAVVMIHVTGAHAKYAETLAALQLGARVHRLRRSRRFKMGSVSSGTGSGGSSGGSGEEMRMNSCSSVLGMGIPASLGCVGEGETGSSDIDPSSSEQSCDTVIYLGPSLDDATDGEHPPVYLPSLENGSGDKQGQLSGIPPPKTKSPKPRAGKMESAKSEEKWVDGPKIKYKHPSTSGRVSADSNGKKSETWIDGPAARVQHQASNFPSPKKTNHNNKAGRNCGIPTVDPAGAAMSLSKAEMIQKWISNQTHTASFLEELAGHGKNVEQVGKEMQPPPFSSANGMSNNTGHNFTSGASSASSSPYHLSKCNNQYGMARDQTKHYYGSNNSSASPLHRVSQSSRSSGTRTPTYGSNYGGRNSSNMESEYRTLSALFKQENKQNGNSDLCNGLVGNGMEMIDVINPEPVVSRDAWLQVTEEDIAMSLHDVEENPLPESDQSFTKSKGYMPCSKSKVPNGTEIECRAGVPDDDHPLRVLSEECLTVVSTFTADSVSLKGSNLDRFWPRLSFQDGALDLDAEDLDHDLHMCSGLCKNLASLSQMSLNKAQLMYTERHRTEKFSIPGLHQDSSPQQSPFHTIGHSHNPYQSSKVGSCYSLPKKLKPVVMPVPDLSDESIYKIPPGNLDKSAVNTKIDMKSKDLSDTEPDELTIPPMKLLDLAPIRSHGGSIASIPVSDSFHNGEEIMTRVSALISPEPDLDRYATTGNFHMQQGQGNCYESPRHLRTGPRPSLTNEADLALKDQLQKAPNTCVTNGEMISGGSHQLVSTQPIVLDTPPSSPSPLLEATKSPSKSKSRKIAKFFRTRSKSPKTVVPTTPNSNSATSGSDSGKSSVSHSSLLSGSSSNSSSPKVKLSSSSSSSSGASSASPSSSKLGSVIAISASKLSSPKKSAIPALVSKQSGNQTATGLTKIPLPRSFHAGGTKGSDYHFTCDSNLPMFLPTPNTAV